ncbi:hypothetical protein F4813DRAFT_368619 [Daldinia decipiens]|uniref:uncharacterized protein n=1 Tax=Daldinia decipiens TaxID=326647 RepID=UPI0020C2D309|nr:uncharacterized protein F4813DRAFT_368619 [Daldinia decipiens]KAI1655092.1 hypothetical protein F4813DRAFT_368619 [Daldinia decipiens]
MITFYSLGTAFFLLTSTTWALPYPFETAVTVTVIDPPEAPPGGYGYGSPPVSTPTTTGITSSTTSATAPPTTIFPSPPSESSSHVGFTGHCDYSYCNSGSNVCFYWAGYTSWDVSRGPIPGEVPTILGPC